MTNQPKSFRTRPKSAIGQVHFGPGAFFRSFNAVFTEDVLKKAGGGWGILAVSLKSGTTRDHMHPRDWVYSTISQSGSQKVVSQVESISDFLVAPENPHAVLEQLASKNVQIVSLTITEKGYCYSNAREGLNVDDLDIQHDLNSPGAPKSAIGFIVEALRLRRDANIEPFTVLSCDNLPENGKVCRTAVLDFAQKIDPGLADWIAANVRFPCTMVDRITPATRPEDVDWLRKETGINDPACVVHEPFRQWVIEDDFSGRRPAWDVSGAQFVCDVNPFELMKLRCLNGTHSALAYLGYLAGYETMADVATVKPFSEYCRKLWQTEIIPTVPAAGSEDLEKYTQLLLERYQNSAIRHSLRQIAMDGSQKLPQRLLNTIQDNLERNRQPSGLYLAVAGWMRYTAGRDEQGGRIDVRDPMTDELNAAARFSDDPDHYVDEILKIRSIFDQKLGQDQRFRSGITNAYESLLSLGAEKSVALYVNNEWPVAMP